MLFVSEKLQALVSVVLRTCIRLLLTPREYSPLEGRCAT